MKGRNSVFKCSVCGKFCSYDRRTVNVKTEQISYFDSTQEQWYPEYETTFTHKKCDKLKEKK